MSIIRFNRFVPTTLREWDRVFQALNDVISQTTEGTTINVDNVVSPSVPAQDAAYVTLAVNNTLTGERVLTVTSGELTKTDNGAGSTVELGLEDVGSPNTYTKVSVDSKGRVTSGTTLAESDIPSEIARDAEVTAEITAAVSAGVAAHVAASDPHAQYVLTPTWYTPASVNKAAGGTATGTVAGVTSMLDGSTYDVVEANGTTPGWDLEFTFSGITRTVTDVVVRLYYVGLTTHYCAVDLWNYTGTPAYDRVHYFTTTDTYIVIKLPMPDFTDYVSGGAAKVRLVHYSTGNPAHTVYVDYVGLRAAA